MSPSQDLHRLLSLATSQAALRAGAALLDAARQAVLNADPGAIAAELHGDAAFDDLAELGSDGGSPGEDFPVLDHVNDALEAALDGHAEEALAKAREALRHAPRGTALGALASGALAVTAAVDASPEEARRALGRAREAVVAVFRGLGHPRPEEHVDVLLWSLLAGASP